MGKARLMEEASDATPNAGEAVLFSKTDGRTYVVNSSGEQVSVGQMVKPEIEAGFTLTIPAGYQFMVYGAYEVNGTLIADGELIIL